jgi:hypothetical protein
VRQNRTRGIQMKHAVVSNVLRIVCACVAIATVSAAAAQVPTAYHPGDKIPYTVRFGGANADKLTQVYLVFRRTTPVHPDQDSDPFQATVEKGEPKTISPGVYEVTIKSHRIPSLATLGSIGSSLGLTDSAITIRRLSYRRSSSQSITLRTRRNGRSLRALSEPAS